MERALSLPATTNAASDLHQMQTSAPGYIKDLEAAMQRFESASPEKRLIGPAVVSPHHHIGMHGSWVDWALVATPNATLKNKVHLCSSDAKKSMKKAESLKTRTPQYNHLKYEYIFNGDRLDNDGFFRVHNDNMPAEPSFAFDKRGRRQSHVAVMSRAVSFTTFGITNEIEAVRRNPFGDNDYLVAFHLVLVGLQGEKFPGLATLLPASSTPQASLSAFSMPAFLFIK